MANKDYYAILGVKKDASADEVKKAFRRLAHEHHPDKGGDLQKFKDINEAYQVLGDASKRATYDRFGSAAFEQGGPSGSGGAGPGFSGFGGFGGINMEDMGDLGEMFGDLFGFRTGGGSRVKRGNDIEVEVTLDFLETVTGASRKVNVYAHARCSTCDGSGAKPGSTRDTCKVCQGKGQVHRATRTIFGTIQSAVQCSECRGTGSIPSQPCSTCKGTGVERKSQQLEISLPAGIANGEGVKIVGAGEYPGPGGVSGDLYVRVQVKSHPVFTREDHDVYSTLRVPYSLLALGGEASVETVDGTGSLKIPEGTEPGTVFKIRQKGFPYSRSGGRGDHLITVQPLTPRKITKEQRVALEQLKQSGL